MSAPEIVSDAADGLFRRACDLIQRNYLEERHHIGAVLLDLDGGYHEGIHLEAMIGRASTCAEACALANAIMAGARGVSMMVAVRHPKRSETDQRIKVVAPCGLCRELLLDYAPDIVVLLSAGQGSVVTAPLIETMPHKYVGTKWNHESGPIGSWRHA